LAATGKSETGISGIKLHLKKREGILQFQWGIPHISAGPIPISSDSARKFNLFSGIGRNDVA